MTNTQLILTNPNKAFSTLITTDKLNNTFNKYKKDFKLPKSPTTQDFGEQDIFALTKMNNEGLLIHS